MSLTILVVFQNCGTYSAVNTISDDNSSTASTCTGTGCATGPEAIQLRLSSADISSYTINITTPSNGVEPSTCDGNNSRCFDVGGYCDTGGYPDSSLTIQLDGPTGFVERPAYASCDSNGRFRVLVMLPDGYNYSAVHNLTVRLYGIDASGNQIPNPAMTNQQTVPVISSAL